MNSNDVKEDALMSDAPPEHPSADDTQQTADADSVSLQETGEDSPPITERRELTTAPLVDRTPVQFSDRDLPLVIATAPLSATGELLEVVVDGATRPLPQDAFLELTPLTHLVFGQATDIGRVRANNQDAVYSFFATGRSTDNLPDFGLFIVADGMGGHSAGEVASDMTVRTVSTEVLTNLYFPQLDARGLSTEQPLTEILADAIQQANLQIMAQVPDGGTTASACVVIGDRAYIAHVGDSRIYLFHHGKLDQLTRDHSLVQRLIELDQISTEEAAGHPQKNVLYRALGKHEAIEVDTLTRRLPPGASLLLCSDGLWNEVSDEEMMEVMSRHRNPQEACQKLIALANSRGGIDNVTAILLHLPG